MQAINVTIVEFGDRDHYQMQWRDPVTGKKKTKSTGILKSRTKTPRKQAEAKAAVLAEELSSGVYVAGDISWADLKRRYLAEARNRRGGRLAAETRAKVQTTFKLIDSHVRPNKARDLTAEKISKWMADLLAENIAPQPDDDETPPPAEFRAPNTVAAYARHLKAALRWAADMGLLRHAPKIRLATPEGTMKDRPIVREEYERMRAAVGKVVDAEQAAQWQRLLDGLWWSGLRLSEAAALSWDSQSSVAVVMQKGYKPAIRFRADGHKAGREELTPCAPEFAELLEATPEADRQGRVFPLASYTTSNAIGKVVSRFGAKGNVVVDPAKGRHASAHSFRRAFGTRWAKRVMPAILKRLMRHKNIETTLKYYVDAEAEDIAADLWAAYERERLASNKTSNTAAVVAENARQPIDAKRLAK